ncbi:hypothetical protein [Devosia sp. A449]
MKITFEPQYNPAPLVLANSGDVLSINGDLFDFSGLQDGDVIPSGAVPSIWIIGPVQRIDGEIHLTLILPHGPNPSPAVAFPEPITVTEDGPIAIPADPAPKDTDNVEP